MQKNTVVQVIALTVLVTLLAACEGLAGEPEMVRTLPAVERPTALPETFDVPVSLNQGAVLYAENCVRCHGIEGAGNGELVLSGEVENVPDFTDPQTIQDMSLQEWFDVITYGRLEALMPPWQDAFTAEERWAVALYTYTMSYTADAAEQGQTLYEAQCAECHAIDGSGTADGSSLLGLVSFSEGSLTETLDTHQSELALSPIIAEAELDDLVQYVRLLSSTSQALPTGDVAQESPPPATTEEVASAESTAAPAATSVEIPQSIGIIRGQIIQGTEDGGSVEGLEAIVHIYDSQLREQIAEYTVGTDGTYQYDEVLIRPDYAYRVSVNYNGISYSSPVRVGNPDVTDMVIDVTIYETGATASDIVVTSRATQINLSSQGLYIIEVIELTNTSDRAFIQPDFPGISEPVSVAFSIPEGAELQLQHTDPNRILLSDDGRMVLDGAPVLPGSEHYVQFGYTLPVENAQSVSQSLDYPVSGRVAFFVENSHLDFTAEGFELTRTQPFNNQTYDIYERLTPPAPGEVYIYSLTLDSTRTGAAPPPVSSGALALLLVVVGVGLVGSAAVIVWRGQNSADESADASPDGETSADLIEQIAQLDHVFKAGEIEKSEYQKKREQLKARLMQLMQSEQPDS